MQPKSVLLGLVSLAAIAEATAITRPFDNIANRRALRNLEARQRGGFGRGGGNRGNSRSIPISIALFNELTVSSDQGFNGGNNQGNNGQGNNQQNNGQNNGQDNTQDNGQNNNQNNGNSKCQDLTQ
jgi:transcription initiation factor TFIID subunit 15